MNMAEDMKDMAEDMSSHEHGRGHEGHGRRHGHEQSCPLPCPRLSSSMDHGRGQELLVKEALHIQMTLQRNASTEMEDWKSLVAGPL